MDTILVTVTTGSFEHFLETFRSRGLELRSRHGSQGVRVLRHAEHDDRVSLLFEWDAERFAGFLADPDVKESMRAGGTVGPPEVVVLGQAAELPA